MKVITRELALSHPFANGKYDHEHANIDFILGHECYKEWLETLPTVDVEEVRHGKWIPCEMQPHHICSVCGHWFSLYDIVNYCPNCGAKMDLK